MLLVQSRSIVVINFVTSDFNINNKNNFGLPKSKPRSFLSVITWNRGGALNSLIISENRGRLTFENSFAS